MRNVFTYTVIPNLPQRLEGLREIAYNLWWSWNQDAQELFRRLDEQAWEATGHNPVATLGRVNQEWLKKLAEDDGFLAHLDRVKGDLVQYHSAKTWYDAALPGHAAARIAYFSAEFGIHESIPIYSGGLGLLAGDHLKSASGLGLPLVGVGLYYYNGYCRQYLNADGWQQEFLHANDFYNLPSRLETGSDGKPLLVSVELPDPQREVWFQIWKIQVGRVPLYLLDARVEANQPRDRQITDQLYGGGAEHRIVQEIALGVGGVRALRKLGLPVEVCHMNEGHSAFLAIERIRILIEEEGLGFDQAREAVAAGNLFTTHTPVPAGIDRFGADQIDCYFGSWYRRLGIDRKAFLALGRQDPHNEGEPFSMAILALKTAAMANGVSKLHGEVSRRMWHHIWKEVPAHEVPITSVTNGCHIRSYVSDQLNELFTRYAGQRWAFDASGPDRVWQSPRLLPDSELWRVHERRRWSLVAWSRTRLIQQLRKRGAGHQELAMAEEVLDPEALTIGFARRFATYKRGNLLLQEPERLARLLNDKDRPVQFIFAGKAHPKDEEGKRLIQQIANASREDRFRKHLLFLEDYDIQVARYLVQGVDVWLNTPRRPMEASGTSGMKAAANGALNCSTLDGWWCEGYDGMNGWAIGRGEEYTDLAYQDKVELRALFDLLEKEIVPLFYQRGTDGLPHEWIRRMKHAMQTCIPRFSTFRMVREYAEKLYLPIGDHWHSMNEEKGRRAREFWEWKLGLYRHWAQIRIETVAAPGNQQVRVGEEYPVRAKIHLGPIDPESVEVQAYAGPLDETGLVDEGVAYTMSRSAAVTAGHGMFLYEGRVPCQASGRFGFTVRVLPRHPNLLSPFIPGLITWSER